MQVSQAFTFLINAIFDIYSFLVVARFLLQLSRADFYNPISQTIIKATDLPLKPLRRLIPSWGSFDVSALILLLGLQLLKYMLISLVVTGGVVGVAVVLHALRSSGSLFINFFFYAIIIQVIASWVFPGNYNPILNLINQVTEPLMAPIRKILPNMGGLDFSPMIALLFLGFLQILLGL